MTLASAQHDLNPEFMPGQRATVGCIQLATDLTLDCEGPALVSQLPGVRLRMQKVELDGERLDLANYESARGRISRAAATLRPHNSLDGVGLACTSLSFALGQASVQAELRAAHPLAQATDMATAILAALDRLDVHRLALLTPYLPELHHQSVRLLRNSGRHIVADLNLELDTDEAITAIAPTTLRRLALSVDRAEAEVVVLCCSAFRACGPGFISALEIELGKPVITSQQAFLWHLLRGAGVDDRLVRYGVLFSLGLTRPQ